MSQMIGMITRAWEAFENADPTTRKIFFWAFLVLIALTIWEQVQV